jgi:predicted NBD/HSP70 family sugar kinase
MRLVAGTVANVVNFVNPGTVVFGGGALRVGTGVFELFEETVRSRTTELAGRRLHIRTASLDFHEGVTGAALLAVEQLFRPESVGLWVEHGSPIGHAAPLQRAAAM